jgi:nicotinate-nucleotide adenylyltransferase
MQFDKMRKLGILGGSFDPVHNGHIGLAVDARDQLGLDEVLLIPAKLQPFKLDKNMVSGEQRLEMIRLAVADKPGLTPCDYELQQEQISYTYKTLKANCEKAHKNILSVETYCEKLIEEYDKLVKR